MLSRQAVQPAAGIGAQRLRQLRLFSTRRHFSQSAQGQDKESSPEPIDELEL